MDVEARRHLGMIKLFGYMEEQLPLVITEENVDMLEELNSLGLGMEKLFLEPVTKREVKRETMKFMSRHFKLHKVPFKRALVNLDALFLNWVPSFEVGVSLCNMTCVDVEPFMIPVRYKTVEGSDNYVISNGMMAYSEEFYRKMKIYYQGIVLNHMINELTESCYVHEITHTQLTKVKGVNGTYFNEEVLPIFLEMIDIYEKGSDYLVRAEDIMRVTDLLYQTSILYNAQVGAIEVVPHELLENSKYANSIVLAYSLFIQYIQGTPALRKYIMQCVQNIFDGEMPLTELLDEFEINFDSSLRERRLIKYLTRLV